MWRGTGRSIGPFAPALAAGLAAAVLVLVAPAKASAQAQEAIELGRLEVEDARQILACFRTYLRTPGRPGADERLRTCVGDAHGRVATVSVPVIRKRVRCLATAIRRVMLALARAEEHGVDDALDVARGSLGECAIEPPVVLAQAP